MAESANQIGECPSCKMPIFPNHQNLQCVCGAMLPSEITGQLPFLDAYPKRTPRKTSYQSALITALQVIAFLSVIGGLIGGLVQLSASNYLAIWNGITLIASGIISGAVLLAIAEILEHVVAIRAGRIDQ